MTAKTPEQVAHYVMESVGACPTPIEWERMKHGLRNKIASVVQEAESRGRTAERARWSAFADENGEPRKFSGEGFAVSADGVILTVGARVWRRGENDHEDGKPFEGWVVLSVDRGECAKSRFRWVTLSGIGECTTQNLYSTREAALAAREGKR